MAEKKKKKKSDKQPSVPEAQMVDTGSFYKPEAAARPEYEPMSLNDLSNWMNKAYDIQLSRAPEVTAAQVANQSAMYRNMGLLAREQGPLTAATAQQLLQQYNPEFRQQYLAQQGDINRLRDVTGRELGYGYELGPELGGEVEQAIRGAQVARGNWLGNAPTAQEAMGKGQTAINLYQQRLGNYNQALGQQQNFLQGKTPADAMGQMAGTYMGSTYYPTSQINTDLGASAMASAGNQGQAFNSTVMSGYNALLGAQQNYNQNITGATSANNEAMFNQYDRTADAWMYREAMRRGLYSQPSVSGGGGGMGGMTSMLGSVGGAVGTGMMGLAASGVIGAGATAGAVGIAGAAAGAAAAICWYARKLIPDCWKSYRKWLFTKATDEERRDYIYNARRLANAIA